MFVRDDVHGVAAMEQRTVSNPNGVRPSWTRWYRQTLILLTLAVMLLISMQVSEYYDKTIIDAHLGGNYEQSSHQWSIILYFVK